MIRSRHIARPRFELLDRHPDTDVQDSEYRRLLGYPRHHVPAERAQELAAWARQCYAEKSRPWVYVREVDLEVGDGRLRIGGQDFDSPTLCERLRRVSAQHVMLVAISAGGGAEDHARQLWQESKPDEYFFLETYSSAVVEHLVAVTSSRICDLAARDGFAVLPHYSPGYAGWDVADQPKLFDLITGTDGGSFPAELEVLASGMLKPKKSLLAVFGIAPPFSGALDAARLIPCENCSFQRCQYRRAPYRPAAYAPEREAAIGERDTEPPLAQRAGRPALDSLPAYSLNSRALRKWAQERLDLTQLADRRLEARFRYEGTTCSNLGRPLAFDYHVTLGAPEDGYPIIAARCQPAPADTGHRSMCAYLDDPESLMRAVVDGMPLLGRPLNDVLTWKRQPRPSGCYCDPDSRTHKWGLVLEVIHYALSQLDAEIAASAATTALSSP